MSLHHYDDMYHYIIMMMCHYIIMMIYDITSLDVLCHCIIIMILALHHYDNIIIIMMSVHHYDGMCLHDISCVITEVLWLLCQYSCAHPHRNRNNLLV